MTTNVPIQAVAEFVALRHPIVVASRAALMFRLMGPRFEPTVARRPMLALFYDLATARHVASLLNANGLGAVLAAAPDATTVAGNVPDSLGDPESVEAEAVEADFEDPTESDD